MIYDRTMDRISVTVASEAAHDHTYSHGGTVQIREGFNEFSPMIINKLSVEEMRDLRYLLDRAIAAADEAKRCWEARL